MTALYVAVFLIAFWATLVFYDARRVQPRRAPSQPVSGASVQSRIGDLQRDVDRPLADLIAEGERKVVTEFNRERGITEPVRGWRSSTTSASGTGGPPVQGAMPDLGLAFGAALAAGSLRDQRQAVWQLAKDVVIAADSQGRAFTRYEEWFWNMLLSQLESLDARLAAQCRRGLR